MPMPMVLPMGDVGFSALESNPNMYSLPSANTQQQLQQQHDMDFDMASASYSAQQSSVTAPSKRSKTNKITTTTDGISVRTGTPLSNSDAAFNNSKLVTPIHQLSQLSLENSNNQNQANSISSTGNGVASSKGKRNKREKEEEREEDETKDEINGSNDISRNNSQHRSSTSSISSVSRQKDNTSAHERNNSVSDEYASDGNSANGNTTNTSGVNGAATATTTSTTTAKRKPYKELLTEDEKRANHIASEQKRRNTIRNGFKDMVEIIPDLRDVNSSKSTILFKAVDFIKQLERRNRILQEKANQLEARLNLQRSGGGNLQQHLPQHPFQQHQQVPMHYSQHPHQQLPHQQNSQQPLAPMHHQNHHPLSYHGSGLDDKRLQEIPNIYPVAISR
ncbi:hypothetical protein BGZ65_003943 [Modicella reniformis]|uniref:BHLH domain-containing protein n=1 Tax=Modicella reniformis TaxID=1440133 RepID=A0A9P6IZH9_9FUNG|nr:hypothetical protein BGZ65_003943 [Modicella reniformis]